MSRESARELPALIPQLPPASCDGCMECVVACTKGALLSKAVEREVLDSRLAQIERGDLREALRSRFMFYSTFFRLRNSPELGTALFSIFLDLDNCDGCGDCAGACGEAFKLVPLTDAFLEDLHLDLYRHLPETPAYLDPAGY